VKLARALIDAQQIEQVVKSLKVKELRAANEGCGGRGRGAEPKEVREANTLLSRQGMIVLLPRHRRPRRDMNRKFDTTAESASPQLRSLSKTVLQQS
jgi:hypothetical protein